VNARRDIKKKKELRLKTPLEQKTRPTSRGLQKRKGVGGSTSFTQENYGADDISKNSLGKRVEKQAVSTTKPEGGKQKKFKTFISTVVRRNQVTERKRGKGGGYPLCE